MGSSVVRKRYAGKQVVTLPPDYGLATPKLGADNLSVFVKPKCGLYDMEVGVDAGGRAVVGVLQWAQCDGGCKVLNQCGTREGGLVAGVTGTTRACRGQPG